jgi:hypothetical protein
MKSNLDVSEEDNDNKVCVLVCVQTRSKQFLLMDIDVVSLLVFLSFVCHLKCISTTGNPPLSEPAAATQGH